jgi:hypothetical protein
MNTPNIDSQRWVPSGSLTLETRSTSSAESSPRCPFPRRGGSQGSTVAFADRPASATRSRPEHDVKKDRWNVRQSIPDRTQVPRSVPSSATMTSLARRRTVDVNTPKRQCLYCLSANGPFDSAEHVIPRSLGSDTERFVIPAGGVCDPCNNWLGGQVDAPFTDRFDMRLSRGLERLSGRRGRVVQTIEGLNATARLDLEIDGRRVTIFASKAEETADGGLDIEIEPQQRDPPDVIARTIRALWKIALGAIFLRDRNEALDPMWDHLRFGVLGYPFTGYLLQKPFTAMVSRRLDVRVDTETPESATAMLFVLGGVTLGLPIAQGATIARAHAVEAGWIVHQSDDVAPRVVLLRLEPPERPSGQSS